VPDDATKKIVRRRRMKKVYEVNKAYEQFHDLLKQADCGIEGFEKKLSALSKKIDLALLDFAVENQVGCKFCGYEGAWPKEDTKEMLRGPMPK